MTITCKNCNQHFKGHFCNNCGQSADTHEINAYHFWHEIQHGLLHIDKGILYTTKQLFVRPGHSIREYINGKRVKHFKPIAFAFILSTIYALISHYSKENTFLDGLSKGANLSAAKRLKGKFDILSLTFNWLKVHYAYGALLTIPIFSLASYLAFYKSGYNYFKHLILNTYIIGQRTVVYIVLVPIVALFKDKDFEDSKIVIGVVLTMWTFLQFFNNNSKLKTFLLTLLTYLIVAVLCFIILVIIGIISAFY